MRLRITGLAFFLAALLHLGGCSGGDGGVVATNPPPATGSIAVTHTLARTVSTFVTTFRFYGLNAEGALVYGPVEFAKAGQVVLDGVPLDVVTLQIEYLSATGAVIGTFETAVAVTTGGTFAVEDPAWVDEPPGVPTLGLASSWSVGLEPQDVVAGDFDGDGNLDFASANPIADAVRVRLGDGAGAFADGVPYAVGDGPGGITAADFDGDGILDLAVGNVTSANVSLLLGRGDGTFDPAVAHPTAFGATRPAGVDMDGDGDLDLVVPIFLGSQVQVLRNDGGGQFTALAAVSVAPANRLFTVAPGDFDGDGDPDVAVASQTGIGRYAVLLNDGDGNLGPAAVVQFSISLQGIVAADLDGDGVLDLAMVSTNGNEGTFFLRGNGDGTFAAATLVGPNGAYLATGDVNGDGRPDLVSDRPSTQQVHVMLGNGDGTFTDGGSADVGFSPSGLDLGDFNGDGRLDILNVNTGDDDATLVLQIP